MNIFVGDVNTCPEPESGTAFKYLFGGHDHRASLFTGLPELSMNGKMVVVITDVMRGQQDNIIIPSSTTKEDPPRTSRPEPNPDDAASTIAMRRTTKENDGQGGHNGV